MSLASNVLKNCGVHRLGLLTFTVHLPVLSTTSIFAHSQTGVLNPSFCFIVMMNFCFLAPTPICDLILPTIIPCLNTFVDSVLHDLITLSPDLLFLVPYYSFWFCQHSARASLVAQMVKNLPAMWETWVQSLGWEDPLGKEMATHSSILAWRIPWTEENGGLQSMALQKVRHNWATNTHTAFS